MAEKMKLKHVCPECKINKWIVDFKEGCSADLTRKSICLFCQQGNELEKLRKENMELKNKVQEIYSILTNIQKSNQELNNEIVSNGKDIHDLRTQLSATRTSSNVRPEIQEEKENTSKNRDQQFIKATGRRVTTRKTKELSNNVTATKNRFSLLSENEEETVLIGDSMVKDQGEHFGLKNKRKRKVRSYPGATTKKIEEEIGKMKIENKKTTIVVQASGNDLFLRNGNAGQTEPLVKQLERTVETVKKSTTNAIILGILPRLNDSHYALSKAIGINDRLERICQKHSVKFLNLWDTFYRNRMLFRKDGIHFSEEGKRRYGNILNNKLYSLIQKPTDSGNGKQRQPPTQGN